MVKTIDPPPVAPVVVAVPEADVDNPGARGLDELTGEPLTLKIRTAVPEVGFV